jgi:murein DD-endopeptidase MepM/ murein hydrolase activator NlpD
LAVKTERDYQQFLPLPSDETLRIAWPTPNRFLFDEPEKYSARTRVNPDYGKPGFTRDCGKRFHRGCDIAPVKFTATGKTTRVMFTDCATGRDFESDEPTFVPHDDVFCVFNGSVVEIVNDENASDFGKHIVVEHAWPRSDEKFLTLYAHLSEVTANPRAQVAHHQLLGRMGQTSRSGDARNWMAVAPHLHFEVRDLDGRNYDPVEFLRRFLPRA